MKKIKVIHVLPDLGFGGGQKLVVDLLLNQNKEKFEISLISLYPSLNNHYTNLLEKNGVRVFYLSKKRGLDLKLISKINKIFRDQKPDIINTHLFCIKYTIFPSLFNKVKVNYHTVHNIAEKEAQLFDKIIQYILFKLKIVIPVAISTQIQSSIKSYYHLKQVPLIYNGVDTNKINCKKKYNNIPLKIVNVSRFEEQKNHLFMLNIAKELKFKGIDFQMDLIGDGYLRTQIEEYIKFNELESHVKLLGVKQNVGELLKEYDLFLMTSIYEGLPLVILEAMVAGLVIVSSDVGGISDVIKDRNNGFLCKLDVNQFVGIISMLIQKKELLYDISMNAKKDSKKYDIRITQKNYEKLYLEKIGEKIV